MLILTSERCPECDSIMYMWLFPKRNNEGAVIISKFTSNVDGTKECPHSLADGVYLEQDGTMVVTRFDEDTSMPEYCCIFCQWRSN